MDNEIYEQEIDLKDLMFAVFRKWRGIILTAVIFGVLLAGYKFGTGLALKKNATDIQEIEKEYYENLKRYESIKAIYEYKIETFEEKIESQENYITNSVLMEISPYNKNVATADIFVITEPLNLAESVQPIVSDYADSIVKAYESIINKAEGISQIGSFDLSGQYIKELITTRVDYDSNMVTVSVTYKDESGARELLDILLSKASDAYKLVQENLGDHEIVIMNEDTAVVTDLELVNFQEACTDSLTVMQKSLDEVKKALNEITMPVNPSNISGSSMMKVMIKYGFFGGVLGAFLSIFYICVLYLMSNKLGSEKELKNRYRLNILGVFSQIPRKQAFSMVDRWFDTIEGRTFRKPDEVYDIIAANICNFMKSEDEILIMGSSSKESMMEVADALKQRLEYVQFIVGENSENLAETLRLLPMAGQIILVETRGYSSYSEIQNQVQLIRSLEKKIIGCVVL